VAQCQANTVRADGRGICPNAARRPRAVEYLFCRGGKTGNRYPQAGWTEEDGTIRAAYIPTMYFDSTTVEEL